MSRSRAGSQFSVHTVYNQGYNGRQASTTSLASSVYSDAPSPSLSNYQFHPIFDQSLLDFYFSYVNQPNITPFDHNFPPSGILSKLSKSFWHQFEGQIDTRPQINDELLNSPSLILTIIRMRLLYLIQGDLEINSIPFMRSSSFKRTDSIISVDSNIDMVNIPQFLPSQLSGPISTPPALPSLPVPFPSLDINKRKPQLGLQQPPPLPMQTRDYFSMKSPSVYSPYEQGFPSPLGPETDSQLKATIMRKRDSLSLKRNGL